MEDVGLEDCEMKSNLNFPRKSIQQQVEKSEQWSSPRKWGRYQLEGGVQDRTPLNELTSPKEASGRVL